MSPSLIPIYDLYGDPRQTAVSGFIHIERIRVRALAHAWNISAHRHATLSQAFWISAGGGMLDIEGQQRPFAAPAMVWLPAGSVHGFRFEPETDGIVVTIAADFLDAMATTNAMRMIAGALEAPVLVSGPPLDRHAGWFSGIEAEASVNDAGARAAISGYLTLLLTEFARAAVQDARPQEPASRSRALCLAFRAEVETHFRSHRSVPAYASALRVSPDRLHEACRTVTGLPPSRLIHDRMMLEAQRALIYTSMSVAEIAFDLGFEDPSYFSRFFTKRAGRSPAAYRSQPEG